MDGYLLKTDSGMIGATIGSKFGKIAKPINIEGVA
jgi:hypothetical protein